MALNFQQSEATAAQRRFPVYLVDATDGITAETGEGGGQPQVSKNGAAFGNTSATLTAIGNGSYYVELTAGELDTLGMVTIRFKSANTAEFSLTGQVVAFDPYAAYALASIATETRLAELDAGNIPTDLSNIQSDTDDIQTRLPAVLVGGRMDSDVGALGGVVQSLTDLKDFADDGYDPATDKVQGVVLVDTTTANSDMRGTENAALASVLGALADVAADGDPTAADTVMQYVKQLINILIGTAGIVAFPAAASPANGVSLAEVLRAVFDDVTGLNGDVMRGTDDAALAVNVPDIISLANINAEVDTALVDARLDELISATAGAVDPTIGSFLDQIMNADGGQTFAQATDSLEALAGASAPTVAQIVDGVWDEAQAGHVGAGSFGLFLDAAISGRAVAGDAMALTAGAVDDIWDELQAGHVGAGSFGLFLDSIVSNIQSDTDDIQTRLPAALVGGAMDSDVSNMQANVVDANALATDAGQEIADRLLARSLATGADGGRTVQDALRLLRNLRQIVAGVLTVMEEDDATPAWTAAVTTAAGDPVDSIDPA